MKKQIYLILGLTALVGLVGKPYAYAESRDVSGDSMKCEAGDGDCDGYQDVSCELFDMDAMEDRTDCDTCVGVTNPMQGSCPVRDSDGDGEADLFSDADGDGIVDKVIGDSGGPLVYDTCVGEYNPDQLEGDCAASPQAATPVREPKDPSKAPVRPQREDKVDLGDGKGEAKVPLAHDGKYSTADRKVTEAKESR